MAYNNQPKFKKQDDNALVDDGESGLLSVSDGDYRRELHLEDPNAPLFSAQSSLPSLPVPDLGESVLRYLKSLEPLLSPEELKRSKEAADEFVRPGGIGETLQRRLKERAAEHNADGSSWLQMWWNRFSYLEYRMPTPINVSYFFHFTDARTARGKNQICRAADLVSAMLRFRWMVADSSLPCETTGKKQQPLCSTAFKYMFSACRIPGQKRDSVRLYDPLMEENNTLVVFYHQRLYEVRLPAVKHPSPETVEALLREVIALAEQQPTSEPSCIGVLTTGHRDTWYSDRLQLLRAGNSAFLHCVQRAHFVLCLDEFSPTSRNEMARLLWHGDGCNRWFDKSIQLIVSKNGKAGLCGEHSMFDGQPTLFMANWVLNAEHKLNHKRRLGSSRFVSADHVAAGSESMYWKRSKGGSLVDQVELGPFSTHTSTPSSLPLVRSLFPKIDQTVQWKIRTARNIFNNLISQHHMETLTWFGYGATYIKKFVKASPDALAQLAMQLAYYKMFGCCRPTYEPVSMRQYRHGRTETVRTVSNESKAFVKAMANTTTGNLNMKNSELLGLLRAACTSHTKQTREALKGLAFDRHLLGLRLLLRPDKGESAAIFDDKAYWDSCHWTISTSNMSSIYFEGCGFGQVVNDGLGCGYIITPDSLRFTVSSCQAYPEEYCHFLEEALTEIWALAGDGPYAEIASKL